MFGEILGGVVTGLGVDAGKDAAREGARRVAEQAGSADREASYIDGIDGPDGSPLWGSTVSRLAEAGVIAKDQAAIVATLLAQRDTELQQIIAALRNDSPTLRSRAVFGAAGDNPVLVELPDLPDNGQQWSLDTVTAWADPGAAGDVLVRLGGQATGLRGGPLISVPLQFSAPRTDVVAKSFKLPARANDTVLVQFVAGAGGAAGDRAAAIFTYKRG